MSQPIEVLAWGVDIQKVGNCLMEARYRRAERRKEMRNGY